MVKLEKRPGVGGALAPSKSGSTQNMAANIKVVVRVRPLNEKELEHNSRVVVDVVDDRMLVFDPKEEIRPFFYQGVQQPTKNFLKRANKELKFVFDNVCSQNASNRDVFETTTKDMLSALMEGYNCSVFAYGATGAGKTFTMIGSKEHPGITYLTMEHLFYTINLFEKEREFDIGVSYIEVYNENVYDLLKPSPTPLQLREDSKYGVMVAGLTLNNIKTARELLSMLENGNKNRTQHPTDANAESSRSHAVFQVYVKMRYKTSSQLRLVKLSMIDLAGSERASATGCVGERFKEGANINKSLLSLGNCINKLADGSNYISYRDSKLTRLLKDSLGGNCKTVMIANVSPAHISYDDTYNTLKYAARANKIQLSIKKNIVDGGMRLSQYVKINEELKMKVKELEAKLSLSSVRTVVQEPDLAKEKVEKEWRRRIASVNEAHGKLEQQLLTLMSRQRVLALRQRLRTRAFSHVADLAHRSSCEAMEQMCTEDIPRQERATESYMKQSVNLDSKVMIAWSKWEDSRKNFSVICDQALSDCPELLDFIKTLQLEGELRYTRARDDLRFKLLTIENEEINAFTEYMSDMPSMLKKLYLTLKGYDKAPPALTEEYLEIMKKAKLAKGITWSDKDVEGDSHFNFVSNLDLAKPSTTIDYGPKKEDGNITVDIITDSEDLTDIENTEPVRPLLKRKGTPIKLANNETIIINDSLEMLDTTRNLNSAKKVKTEYGVVPGIENYIDAKDLNSTFVLGGKMETKRPFKMEKSEPVKRGLTDRTNVMQRSINFNEKAKIVKPVVGKALPFRRPAPLAPHSAKTQGFGSSLSRDGTPLQRNTQAKMIIQRWTHIRDNYNRSCKKIKDQKSSGSGAKTAKPYVYSKQLSFLQKVIQPKETINNVTTENNNMESNKNIESEIQNNNSEGGNETLETNSIETHGTTAAKSPIPNRVPKRSLKNIISPVDAKMMKFMDSFSNNEPKTMNRHLSFFNGILPSLDKYNDDEVLEFQMGVLQLMKKIKNSRQICEPSSFHIPSDHRGYFTQQYQNNIQEATNSISTNMTTMTSVQSPSSVESAASLLNPSSVESCYSNYTDVDYNDF